MNSGIVHMRTIDKLEIDGDWVYLHFVETSRAYVISHTQWETIDKPSTDDVLRFEIRTCKER